MTHNDILRASLLDLLFEGRNKLYGAYVLRKYYDRRLSFALGGTLGGVLLLGLLVSGFRPASAASAADLPKDTVEIRHVVLPHEDPKPPIPDEPPKAKPQTATVKSTASIQITKDITDVPTDEQLEQADPGTETKAGTPPTGVATPPVTETGTSEAPKPAAAPAEVVPAGPTVAPSFPGGMPAWLEFLRRNLREPSDLAPGDKRTVRVRFWVGEDGAISRLEVEQSGGSQYDAEVMRVLKRMGRWNPALQNGRPVATSFVQPVTFIGPEE